MRSTIIRGGVRLSPKLAEIFDTLSEPASLDQLCEVFYSGKPRHDAANCVKVQIHGINDLLRETDYAICSNGKRPPTYRVVRVANDNHRGAVERAA
jgi:hypothetical protein